MEDASGTPVIVSDRVGLASVINQADAGVVIEPTQAALSAGLARILSDPAAAGLMGKRGRQQALEVFTWDRIVPKLKETYLRIIEAHCASSAAPGGGLGGK